MYLWALGGWVAFTTVNEQKFDIYLERPWLIGVALISTTLFAYVQYYSTKVAWEGMFSKTEAVLY
jgi:hypothetical protein